MKVKFNGHNLSTSEGGAGAVGSPGNTRYINDIPATHFKAKVM